MPRGENPNGNGNGNDDNDDDDIENQNKRGNENRHVTMCGRLSEPLRRKQTNPAHFQQQERTEIAYIIGRSILVGTTRCYRG